IQRTAVVAVKGGEVQLPEIRLPWWDTLNQQWREAVVPARTLKINGGVATPEPPAAKPVQAQAEQPAPMPETSATDQDGRNYFWPLLSLVLVLGWGLTTWLLIQRRNQNPGRPATPAANRPRSLEEAAYAELERAASSDWHQIRPLLLNWARARWPQQPIHALADLLQQAQSPALTQAVQALEAQHYSAQRDGQGDRDNVRILLDEVRQLREPTRTQANNEVLAELYPSGS